MNQTEINKRIVAEALSDGPRTVAQLSAIVEIKTPAIRVAIDSLNRAKVVCEAGRIKEKEGRGTSSVLWKLV